MITVTVQHGFDNIYFKFSTLKEKDICELLDNTHTQTGNVGVSKYGTQLFKNAIVTDPSVALGGEPGWQIGAERNIVYNLKSKTVTLQAVAASGRIAHVVAGVSNRDLKDYIKELNPIKQLENLKGKLLRFTYDGGTTTGVRIIRLEEVKEGTRGSILLKGVDLCHALDPKSTDKGYRTYKLEKIDGKIDVIN